MQALLDAISALELPAQACRVFHGRGGQHPGFEQWSLDFYPPVWLLTSHQRVEAVQQQQIHQALKHRWSLIAPDQTLNLVMQSRIGTQASAELLCGMVPKPHLVCEGDAQFQVELMRSRNHGLFLDMAGGREWLRQHLAQHPGLSVLNLFAYTGAFSVVALQAGASQVINVDMSAGAISVARRNHATNGVMAGAQFWVHDVFNSWAKIRRHSPYDLVIVDPPSFQKGSFVATKDYPRVLRRLSELIEPGGHALLCLNAPELGPIFLHEAMAQAAPDFVYRARVPNPLAFDDVSSERSLKVLVYQKESA